METLGQVLNKARKNCGLSQQEVAEKLGLSQTAIVKYEGDKIKRPNRGILQQMAELYKVNFEELNILAYPKNQMRVPSQIYQMIQEPDAIPFLSKAYKEYMAYRNDIQRLHAQANVK
mgnify:CR=1 FL=1